MPYVASLINKSNIKKLRNNQHTEPLKYNCTNKNNCLVKGSANLSVLCIRQKYIVVDLMIVMLVEC